MIRDDFSRSLKSYKGYDYESLNKLEEEGCILQAGGLVQLRDKDLKAGKYFLRLFKI